MNTQSPVKDRRPHIPFRLAAAYLVFGLSWILLTDLAVAKSDLARDQWFVTSSGKGALFVFLSAALLYAIARYILRAVIRADALVRAVIDGTTDTVFVKDREGKYLLLNEAAAGFVAQPIAAILGTDDYNLFDAETARRLIEQDRRVMETGLPETEEQTLTAAGVTRAYFTVKAPYRDVDGQVIGVVGISRDISDRKRSEERLRVSEAFSRGVLASVPAHLAVIDQVGTILTVNHDWVKFSIDNAELKISPAPRTGIGSNYLAVCDESTTAGCDDARAVAAGIRTVLGGSTPRFSYEYPCPSPKEPRWFILNVVPLTGDSGGAVISHTDITARKLAERTVARLATYPEHNPNLIVEVEPGGRLRYANPPTFRAFPDLVDGSSDHPLLAAAIRLAQDAPTDTSLSALDEFDLGDRSYVGIALRFPNEDSIRFYLTDITPQRQAQAALVESEKRFRALTENATDIVTVFDAGGQVLFMSPSIRQLGYDPDELVGTVVLDLVHPDDRTAVGLVISRGIAAPLSVERVQFRYRHKNGQWVDLESTGHFVPGLYGPGGAVVVNSRDMTEQRRAEDALRIQTDLHAMLARTNLAVSQCQTAIELYREVCTIAVETGRLKFAWVGVRDGNVVKPIAPFEAGDGHLSESVISLDENDPDSGGPIGRAFLNGESCIVNDFMTSVMTSPWHQKANQAGFASAAAFPVREGGQVVAVLTIYADTVGFFTDELVTTLGEITPSLSFALDKFVHDREAKQGAAALEESEARFRTFMQHSPIAQWLVDSTGTVLTANSRFDDLFLQNPADVVGKKLTEVYPRGGVTTMEELAQKVVETESVATGNVTLTTLNRVPAELWVVNFPVPRAVGEPLVGGLAVDMTELRRAEERLRVLGAAIESSPNAVFIADRNGVLRWVNLAFTRMTGYSFDEAVGQTARLLKSGKQDATFYRGLWDTILAGRGWSGEVVERRKDGTEYVVRQTITPLAGPDGKVSQFVAVQEDVTASKGAEARLRHMAMNDALTGLLNRVGFRERLTAALTGESTALHFLDLDRFKLVNDALGHEAGDELLRQVAERIRHRARGTDSIGRLGGDEFAIVQPGLRSPDDAAALARALIDAINQPFVIDGQEVRVGVSIGVTLFPQDGGSPEDLLKNADLAMYRAKHDGRGTFRFFAASMGVDVRSQLTLEGEIRQGIASGEFELYYQPQVRVADGTVVGAEALIRWRHPTRGLLSPGAFLAVAEDNGLIIPLSDWILRAACAEARRWVDQGHNLRVAVNVSVVHVERGDLEASVEAALLETGLPPNLLELEVTEGLFLSDKPATVSALRRLKTRGMGVSIDDFGTGYSSLSYLRRLPVDELKIDQSFVSGIPGDPKDSALVRAIIGLANDLGLKVVAEGVETPEQIAFLKAEGCDEAQGYLLSRPIPVKEFDVYLAAHFARRT